MAPQSDSISDMINKISSTEKTLEQQISQLHAEKTAELGLLDFHKSQIGNLINSATSASDEHTSDDISSYFDKIDNFFDDMAKEGTEIFEIDKEIAQVQKKLNSIKRLNDAQEMISNVPDAYTYQLVDTLTQTSCPPAMYESNNSCKAVVTAIFNNAQTQTDAQIAIIKTELSDYIADISSNLDILDENTNIAKPLLQLLSIKEMEYNQIQNAVESQRSTAQTDQRKVVYEDWATENLGNVQYWLTVFYFFLFIVYLAVGDFFSNERYKLWQAWLGIIVYIALPYLVKPCAKLLFYIWYQIKYFFSSRMPKDAYYNI